MSATTARCDEILALIDACLAIDACVAEVGGNRREQRRPTHQPAELTGTSR